MRPIKFRAWDVARERMVGVGKINFTSHAVWNNIDDSAPMNLGNEQSVVLMQFTGLHDKNGKEIWEGDVVKKIVSLNKERHGDYTLYEIKMQGCVPILYYLRSEKDARIPKGMIGDVLSNSFNEDFTDIDFHKAEDFRPIDDCIEVLGSIYENPELLK